MCVLAAGPILSTADIYREEQYRQRNMFETAAPPGGACLFTPSPPPSLTHTLTHSLIRSLTHSLTHSAHQLTQLTHLIIVAIKACMHASSWQSTCLTNLVSWSSCRPACKCLHPTGEAVVLVALILFLSNAYPSLPLAVLDVSTTIFTKLLCLCVQTAVLFGSGFSTLIKSSSV